MAHSLRIFAIFCLLSASLSVWAQGERKDKTAVTYEELYDEPYSINKLFIHLQPFYGELFVTNVNAGFGFEANYFHKDKANFKAHFRKTYSQKFFDQARDLAAKNSTVENTAQVFNYFEVGGTYHIRDFEESSKTKMFLFKNSYKGNKWAARVPLNADVPCKVRKIYGGRLGSIIWDSSTDLDRALEAQKIGYDRILNSAGAALPSSLNNESGAEIDMDAFTNISSVNVYLGGSMTWIRNVAVSFDKFEEGIDDLIFTTFIDFMYAPLLNVDDVRYNGMTYDVSALKTRSFGFRAGLEGKFNRTWGWAYGGEIGYRPGIQGRNFFALFKISFPVYSTQLDYKVEAFGK